MGVLTDILLAAFLLFETWRGYRTGLLWQVASLATLGLGFMLGGVLAPPLGARLLGVLTENPFHAQLLAFVFVAGLVGCMFRALVLWAELKSERGVPRKERERRRGEDRILGGVFGALKGSVLALAIIAAGVSLLPDSPAWRSSRLAAPLAEAGTRLLPAGAAGELRAWLEASATRLRHGLQIRVLPPPPPGVSRKQPRIEPVGETPQPSAADSQADEFLSPQ